MTTVLDTVLGYEDQLVDYVKKARKPVTSYVAKGVNLLEDRLPDVSYPASVPTPIELVETQADFVKKLVDANTQLVTAVLETVAPLAGYATGKKAPAKKATRATRSTKAA